MSFRVLGLIFSALIISTLGVFFGGSSTKKMEVVAEAQAISMTRIDPEGSLEEQLAYHLGEIKKYQAAILKEEANANLYLVKNQMNEVRQANSRKFQYSKKIEEHREAIEGLQIER